MFTSDTIGHFHPLIIHLPIGILLFGFLLMLMQHVRKVDLEAAVSLAFLTGSITAAAACVAGWLLAQSGEYEPSLVSYHQWTGLATTALGFLTFFAGKYRIWLAAITVIVLSVAGHFGGSLTHGEDYLFSSKSVSEIDQKAAFAEFQALDSGAVHSQVANTQKSAPMVFVYRDEVVPILKNKCYSCHSATKMKGGLRLDSEEFIKKGGKNGRVLLEGHPTDSPLIKNLLLPIEHEDHMPPKGKPQLTRREISILHAWVSRGASFVPQKEKAERQLLAVSGVPVLLDSGITSEVINSIPSQVQLEQQILLKDLPSIPAERVKVLQQKNILITPMKESSSFVTVNFVNVSAYESSLLDEMMPLEKHVMWLRMPDKPVTDEDVRKISTFSNLTRLHLENTTITDQALGYLKNLPHLEQLNLYGTAISDVGLRDLVLFPALQVVYLWQTNITEDGVARLKKLRPELRVEIGGFRFIKPDTSTIQK
ncbi:c-type cytochrome domain-containing protein [Arundinibacter roseus]|uniref:Cytochrome C Planctomycete-type domain-containing protein n=1 Tax=Arundinibacter roseus TaxID=2070510 RepID=A0A4R4KKM6_9BACT|nr:c-type cytochrome domain-containing protein [Arundinibacter roseus]TDB67546.1 hypothetical protein EZE20_06270 [Arundinibacter roseus]